jgi:hypothetical protein
MFANFQLHSTDIAKPRSLNGDDLNFATRCGLGRDVSFDPFDFIMTGREWNLERLNKNRSRPFCVAL